MSTEFGFVRLRPSIGVLVGALLLLFGTTAPAAATWSIAVADTDTQEVAVASATCVTGIDLRAELATVRVGVGAGAAQSQLDSQGTRRRVMWDGLIAGQSSSVIMQQLAGLSGSSIHQNGLADTGGDSATFSGSGTFAHSSGVTGQIGTLHYAIQGNILTGRPVIDMAETALRNPANGDLPGRLMAAMEAARAMGGDGRCSCSPSAPTACGAPPASFTKSADVGFLIVARFGDGDDGNCSSNGCADGDYFLDLNVPFEQRSDPDPVLQLQQQFDAFRQARIGRPDAIRSSVTITPSGDDFVLVVTPRDWQGTDLATGVNSVEVAHAPGSALATSIGPVTALGDGRFQAVLTTVSSGLDRFLVTLRDGVRDVVIPPRRTTLTVDGGGGPPAGDGLDEDFEGDVSGWAASGLWHLVSSSNCSPGFNSPSRAFYFGQDASCTYATGGTVSGTLTSPVITGVGTGSTLTFAFRRQVESFSGDFDRTEVDVSADGGATWTEVFSRNSANPSANAWGGSPAIDVSGFAGDNVRVRFRFESGDNQFNGFLGWMIDDVTVTAGSTGGGGGELVSADFESGLDGFVYRDDAFSTNAPAYAAGSRVATGGFSGAGIEVRVGGIDNADILGMSGGFDLDFDVAQAGPLTVTLRVNLTQAADYESDEFSDALLAFDGTVIGTGGNGFLARVTGNGNGGGARSTGWISVTIPLGTVAAGTHTLTVGGSNNKKTFNNESTTIRFDDIVVTQP